MKYDPKKHHRRSLRLKGHDYAGGGCYFVTICAHREAGRIFDDKLAREIIHNCWQNIPLHYPEAVIKDFVIMGDHVHGIIWVGARHASPVHHFGNIVGSFKSAVSRELRRAYNGAPVRRGNACVAQNMPKIPDKIWQQNYYEVIVWSAEVYERISKYIRLNPWKCIQNFGNGLRGLGNPTLWDCEKLGVLCSRNAPKIGYIPESEVYFGGWHSPKEKEIFDWLLEKGKRIIVCPAWRIESILNEKNRDKFSLLIEALEENRLLVLQMPDRDGDLWSAECRNRFVVEHADSLFTPYVKKGGMLDKILRVGD